MGKELFDQHKSKLAERICQNIKRHRATVFSSIVEKYFGNIIESIQEIPPSHILNYDETNWTNDLGRKKIILIRGTKYPERIMISTKSATSMMIMYAGYANGYLLPPYLVGRPTGAHYKISPSG